MPCLCSFALFPIVDVTVVPALIAGVPVANVHYYPRYFCCHTVATLVLFDVFFVAILAVADFVSLDALLLVLVAIVGPYYC